jgi:DNA-binding NarL/FixJ family response regulator
MNSTTPGPASMKVFIVEDSSKILERLKRSIADLPGLDIVGTAVDVKPAIAALELEHPDALILDLQLPSGTGLEVLRAVRRSQPTLRVIVFTNFADEPYREAAMAAGANEFLDKNADFPRVREILSRWTLACQAQTTTH